jgi:hypothetical protein
MCDAFWQYVPFHQKINILWQQQGRFEKKPIFCEKGLQFGAQSVIIIFSNHICCADETVR